MRVRSVWILLGLVGCGASSVSAPDPPPAAAEAVQSAATSDVPASAAEDGLEDLDGVLRGLQLGARDGRPVVVALHGRGDHPARFVRLASEWADVAHVVVPAATSSYGSGFSWFHIRARQDDASLAAAVDEAARRVVQLVNRRRPSGTPIVVTGFSQGGMLSFALATRPTPVVDGAVPMGGFLPRGLWPDAMPEGAPPIFAVHGEADKVIPVEAPRATVAHLQSLGWKVSLETTPGVGHSLDAGMRQRVDGELRRMLER